MMMRTMLGRTLFVTVCAVALSAGAFAAEKKPAPKQAEQKQAEQKQAEQKQAEQKVDMKVTDKGFEPANVSVKKGQPVTLVITRTTEKTCATEIVIDEYGIKTELPLGKPVQVSFTPNKAGKLKYGCAMGKMVGGILTIQ